MENVFYNKAIKKIGIINCVLAGINICGFLLLGWMLQVLPQPSGMAGLYLVFPLALILFPLLTCFLTCCIAWLVLTINAFKNMSKFSTAQNIILAIVTCIFTGYLVICNISLFRADKLIVNIFGYLASIVVFLLYSIIRKNELNIKKFIMAAMAYLFPIIIILIGDFCVENLRALFHF